jgi:cephalosporin hydroxylase
VTRNEAAERRRAEVRQAVRQFHTYYYPRFRQTYWFGVRTWKCPLDLWIYQEILFETRPDLVIETGTNMGGSAHFFACVLDQLGDGRVLTIDVRDLDGRPSHPRITYLTGSSVDREIVARASESLRPGEKVMAVLDSNHHKEHVLSELRAYSRIVTVGQYLIVEDTNLNGRPVLPEYGPGPHEAVQEFLAEDRRFEVDRSREKFMMTFNPGGFLKRVA